MGPSGLFSAFYRQNTFAMLTLRWDKALGAPAKSKILWGEEEGMEQSGGLAVRRGQSGRNFFRRCGT